MTDKVKFWIKSGELRATFPNEYDALEVSIQKWEYVIEHVDEISMGTGVSTCGLCLKYFDRHKDDDMLTDGCYGCPVRYKTGHAYCYGSPFRDFTNRPTKENAQAELGFLKSLRK